MFLGKRSAGRALAALLLLLFTAPFLASCGHTAGETVIEMELTRDYAPEDPFIHEKLFYVSSDVDALELKISFQMEGERGTLEIADNETDEVFWSKVWEGTADTAFPVSLAPAEKEREYVIRFTGTKVEHAKITMASEDPLVKERERPRKPNRG